MKPIPILIVGLGQWGSLWIEDVLADPYFYLAAVVDRRKENTDRACTRFSLPKDRAFTSLEAAIGSTPPGVAIITVPPEHHFSTAVTLIDAGFHILSEKPLANSFKEALVLRDLAKKQTTIFMVSQDYRWQPPIQTIRRQIAESAIGVIGYGTYRHFQALRIGGWREQMEDVILEDMAIHHFDILRSISGLNCLEVYAESMNPSWSWYRGGAVTSVQLKFEKDFHVNYFATWVTTGPEDSWPGEVRIEGSHGAISMNARGEVFYHSGAQHKELPLVAMIATGRKYALLEMQNALSNHIPPETSIEDNIQSYAITQAAMLSAKQHRPVSINEIFTL